MPTKLKRTALALAGLLAVLTSTAARGDELADKGRAIFTKNKQAVVTVQLVLKNKFSGGGAGASQATESKTDATGTVIDPSGLTVVSLSATDPSQLLQNMMSAMSEGDAKFKMESELSDLKILLEDGTEVPAEVVLRDKDLDLAFIRPKAKPATPMTAIDLATGGKAEVLDQLVALNRLGNAAGRSYAAAEERISAVVLKPRLFYIPQTSSTPTTLGAPAFTLDGKPLGVFVMRSLKGKGSMNMLNMQPENVAGIILPAAEILKAAQQVPAAADEKKDSH